MFSAQGLGTMATWIAAGIAVIAVIAAFRQIGHAKEVHREQMQPYVFADIRPASSSKQLVVLFLRNVGPTVATDVRVVFDRPLKFDPHMHENPQSEWAITALPPGGQLEWNLGFSGRFFEVNEKRPIRTKVTFQGRNGSEEIAYDIDLHSLGLTSGAGRTISEMAESTHKIDKHLSKIVDVLKGRRNGQ